MAVKSVVLGLVIFALVACSSDSGGGAYTQASPAIVLEVDDSGQPIAYLSSDNVDPSFGVDDVKDGNFHKIASLPHGLVQVCHDILSQGVYWTVWAVAANQDSRDFAKVYCQWNGQ